MDTQNVKVSVIIPVYNVEKYLRHCLDSVVAQTLNGIEIICVNDGSPDNSQAILEEYAEKYSNVKVIVKKNGGLSDARNCGMKVAQGKYIAFVDSDDFIEKDMMERLYQRASEADADIVVGDLYLYDNKTKETSLYRDQALYLYLKNKIFKLQDYPEFLRNIAAWDRIYKREFVERIGVRFPEGFVYEDAFFTFVTLAQAERIAVVPKQFYYYRKNSDDSITGKEITNDKYKKDFLEINRRTQEFLEKIHASKEIRQHYLHYFMQNALFHQGNATTYSFFKVFFKEMQELLVERDYLVIEQLPFTSVQRYGKWLQEDSLWKAYWYCVYRTHVERDGAHTYFRFRRSGRRIKLK